MTAFMPIAKRLFPLAKKYGPRVMATVTFLTHMADKNPQAKKFADDTTSRLKSKSKTSLLSTQISLAKEFATEAMTDETVPERQEIVRLWVQRAKVQEMALRASENLPRKVAKARHVEIADGVDFLLAEIIETRGKWSELGWARTSRAAGSPLERSPDVLRPRFQAGSARRLV